ncbi:hypothetical protein GNI_130490 [Gregarina niphandrodes]|uniref:Uncharacterized protein n=1 Tax=Gregarina niphandrodes TaxID=110365 RepID=A0A023B1P5_GRENI|nr:hypothetical protein GNI_130490 [Gregarina niphandrodes]EZG47690.1 hypothetical protein GNI_130490 [Gregarina niphandrodes]|eukprot:XP_011132143.1 hypothetical protein GNI_130490 [Gregarina niphandrodes]
MIRRVLLEWPTDATNAQPPEELLITFPSRLVKKTREVGDELYTLKDRLPLTYKRRGVTDESVTVSGGGKKRGITPASPLPLAGKLRAEPVCAANAMEILRPERKELPLDEQLEEMLLRAADDDRFDESMLAQMTSQLKIKACREDTLVVSAAPDDVPASDRLRNKRTLDGRDPLERKQCVWWEYDLTTEIAERIDNEWFRKIRKLAASAAGGQRVVLDAPAIPWWRALPGLMLVVPSKRGVRIAAHEGIAPDLGDDVYYDEYKDAFNEEYSDADSIDYAERDAEEDLLPASNEDSEYDGGGWLDSDNEDPHPGFDIDL